MICLEQLGATEGARLRSIRLRALMDAPDAFGSTFDEACARSTDDWAEQAMRIPTFIAVADHVDVGMVRCVRDKADVDTAWLISMWVAPEVRRKGIGGDLVDLVIAWAHEHGIRRVVLDVADSNAPAIALYEAKGFRANGKAGSMPPPREHITEHQRELTL
jgi:ribosomal protein S18 acetylase RimI-like enzyme